MFSWQRTIGVPLLCAVALTALPRFSAADNRSDLVTHDFAEERIVDLAIVKKVAGHKKILLLSVPQYTEYLEGFIRGMVVDYNGNPVEGVLVRVGDPGVESPMFDPTVTNFNGIYRIRFSIPFDKKGRVDLRNKLVYAPDWQQKRDLLGNSYEPLDSETPFHLYYDRSTKTLAFDEGLRKCFVNPVTKDQGTASPSTSTPAKKSSSSGSSGGGDDFFKAFGGF